MDRLINRGLNFSILPYKLDITQVLVDHKKYSRSVIWNEFFYGRDEDETEKPIFRTEKTNLPKNYSTPEDLKVFLNSVKSEILDPRNRNTTKSNLPEDEIQALKELQQMQRERKIVVKACDKGAGIIIFNFDDYLKTCYERLTSQQINGQSYYSQASDIELEQAKHTINTILKEGLDNNYINKNKFDAMIPDEKKAGRFYINFTVHKEHDHLPPPRPIISGSGSITENLGTFIEHHIKDIATKHEAYIQDTPDFLRAIDKINKGEILPPKTHIVTWDVRALFTNILHKEGHHCFGSHSLMAAELDW